LAWFESNAKKSVLYTDVAEQLLSVSITGSTDVERAAKPLKHSVLIEKRTAMSVGTVDIALRAGFALHFLQAAKKSSKSAVGNYLSQWVMSLGFVISLDRLCTKRISRFLPLVLICGRDLRSHGYYNSLDTK
jgi:hypothetical protein